LVPTIVIFYLIIKSLEEHQVFEVSSATMEYHDREVGDSPFSFLSGKEMGDPLFPLSQAFEKNNGTYRIQVKNVYY